MIEGMPMRPIPEKDLFMMCPALEPGALRPMPEGFAVRNCRKDELDAWIELQADDPSQTPMLRGYLMDYFQGVYAREGDRFFENCVFAVDRRDVPVGTVFIWKAYASINTVHWFKVRPALQGLGIGRALLGHVLGALPADGYPVFLHTHPSSYRAIKLYSDFGFRFLTDERVGSRPNNLKECLPILEEYMPPAAFSGLKTIAAPRFFLDAADSSPIPQF
jgi:ribosomal protein S18 acetylase RimI-like enzyme